MSRVAIVAALEREVRPLVKGLARPRERGWREALSFFRERRTWYSSVAELERKPHDEQRKR